MTTKECLDKLERELDTLNDLIRRMLAMVEETKTFQAEILTQVTKAREIQENEKSDDLTKYQ